MSFLYYYLPWDLVLYPSFLRYSFFFTDSTYVGGGFNRFTTNYRLHFQYGNYTEFSIHLNYKLLIFVLINFPPSKRYEVNLTILVIWLFNKNILSRWWFSPKYHKCLSMWDFHIKTFYKFIVSVFYFFLRSCFGYFRVNSGLYSY